MPDPDACGLTYVYNGDVKDCRLRFNHDEDCVDANRAFRESLVARSWYAQNIAWL